jgi:hypothetical protein
METIKTKVKQITDINQLAAQKEMYINAGYKTCKRCENPSLKVVFKQHSPAIQKTVYFKK